MKRAILASIFQVAASALAAQDSALPPLARALEHAYHADWQEAADAAREAGEPAGDIVLWQQLRAGVGSFDQYRDFLDRRPDWPGLALLRQMGEASIPDDARPDAVIAYFSAQLPGSAAGSLRLSAALRQIGVATTASDEARRAWLTLTLDPAEQQAILDASGDSLEGMHDARLDLALWQSRLDEAEAMLPLASPGAAALGRARLALQRGEAGVDALIAAIPAGLRSDPGLAYARFKWRFRAGRTEAATELMLEQSDRPGGLGRAEAWAADRNFLARDALGNGNADLAYRLAAGHGLTGGGDYAQLEWLAGYIALTRLDDPQRALDHFRRVRTEVLTPISLGRAGYWEGRALEAMGQEEGALQAYRFAAEFQTSFYGQLAAIAAGLPMDAALAGTGDVADLTGTAIGKSSVLTAALMLREAGQVGLFRQFMRHLSESGTLSEQAALAELALRLDEPYASIDIAKFAAESGDVMPRHYFPLPRGFDRDLPVPPELALAVARRESEFDPFAVSSAGARGLMQLMPGTAAQVGAGLGIEIRPDALTEDAALNITLGTAYLARLIGELDGYLPAVVAGYNAGPEAAKRWLAASPPPRDDLYGAVDWIEAIPYGETRNYVMRVLEGYEVYRARLAGRPLDWSLDRVLTGRMP